MNNYFLSLLMLSPLPNPHIIDQKGLPYIPEKAHVFVAPKSAAAQPAITKDKMPINFQKKPLSLSLVKVPVFESERDELYWDMNVSMNKGKVRPGISLTFRYM